ncbi:MAG: reverse transcriptase domain-containing protein [Elusimicrobia bacterium]|nr:reverse transcriptase domain-containing protein [Elusimicrobiota bacterium]
MKTYKLLYEQVCSFENMYEAFRKAAKGKSLRLDCAGFAYNREREIFKLQAELLDGTYRHGPYREFEVRDPKRRQVKAARFCDRVVHHALCNIIEPIFEARFIPDSFACRKGKGTFAALARCSALARRFSTGYVLKADISKFFYSVDHAIMLNTLGRRIADKRVLALIAEILGSSEDKRFRSYFPNDDLFALQRPTGIPIGNLTSQLFSNIYLTELDYFVKQELRWKPYLRYMDDFLFFGPDKKELWFVLSRIEAFLAEKLRLRVHPEKRTVSPVKCGIDWVGYTVFPERVRVRRRNIFRFRSRNRKLRELFKRGRIHVRDIKQSVMSFCAYTSHADANKLTRDLLELEIF